MRKTTRRDQTTRGAFTLIELLVVLAIIALLITFSAAAYLRYVNTQQLDNTQTILKKVNAAFARQWSVCLDKFRREPLPTSSSAPLHNVYNYILTNVANNDTRLARVVWVKFRMKQAFPQTVAEAYDPSNGLVTPAPCHPGYMQYLTNHGITSTTTLGNNESSVCLFMALQQGLSGAGVSQEELGGGSSSATYSTPGGVSVPYLVDGWSNPIAFCRWPTGSSVLANDTNLGNGQSGLLDPGDPEGLLTNATWLGLTSPNCVSNFQTLCHAIPTSRDSSGGPLSYNLTPLLASPGADGNLGLNPLTFATTVAGDAQDNLYSVVLP